MYSVRVDDGRYGLGDYPTCEAATRVCRLEVDRLLREEIASRKDRGEPLVGAFIVSHLFGRVPHCDTPFIASDDQGCRFSAFEYAEVRFPELLEESPPTKSL